MPTRSTAKDAIALLKEDHQTVRGFLSKLEKTTERAGDAREELLGRIEQEIKIHTAIEEEIFYPAYKEAVSKKEDAKLYQEALEEHHVADTVLMEIKQSDTGSEIFSAKAKVLKELVEHHADEEEKEMFPRARREMEASQLKELGTQMEERKKQLQASGEGWLPTAGKLLGAMAGKAKSATQGMRSAAARGAAPAKKRAAAKSGTSRSRAKSGKATASRARSAGAKSRKK